MQKTSTQKIIGLLLSGKHPKARKYAGHHVLVTKSKIVPLKEGQEGIKDIENLEEKWGETPTLVFVPRKDVSYILVVCAK